MHVTKGSCIGQTFALAKPNDSPGGKRSKRRSKEERKGMVETFVKRYQASNNGSFPSLRLTHKEVGGSYYTVREVFQELIQENRVLALPKLPPEEQNMENLGSFLENYPLGSISLDNQKLLNEYKFRLEKISELQKRSLDDTNILNRSTMQTLNSEVEEPNHTELVVEDTIKEVEVHQGHIRPLPHDVVVETFPLRPVSCNLDVKTSENDIELETGNDEIRFEETTANKNISDIQLSEQTVGTRLNNINLESLEAATLKKSDSQETNLIVSFTKKFIAGFMKFWSE